MVKALVFDKRRPIEERRQKATFPSIESIVTRYNDADKYAIYVNGNLVNIVIKEETQPSG